jgi:hypothetical protein
MTMLAFPDRLLLAHRRQVEKLAWLEGAMRRRGILPPRYETAAIDDPALLTTVAAAIHNMDDECWSAAPVAVRWRAMQQANRAVGAFLTYVARLGECDESASRRGH